MTNSGLKKYFDKLLSVEDVGLYKPHSRVYSWATRKMGVEAGESKVVAAHGWDMAGAICAAWQTAFISRPGKQLYPLADKPDLIAPTFTLIAEKLLAARK